MSQQPGKAPSGSATTLSRLERALVESKIIGADPLQQAAREAQARGEFLPDTLGRLKLIPEETLARFLAQFYQLSFLAPGELRIQPGLLELLPQELMQTHQLVPVAVDREKKQLEIAIPHVENTAVLDKIAQTSGYRVRARITTPGAIRGVLNNPGERRLSTDDALAQAQSGLGDNAPQVDGASVFEGLQREIQANDAPVVQLVNAILYEAIERNASDVHIESQKEGLLVRFRIDGILLDIKKIPKNLGAAFISRIKVCASMDISERRRPQDGRMTLNVNGQDIDMRVNTLAIQYGESLVIRILNSHATSVGLEALGLGPNEIFQMMRAIKAPNGIILVSGPTGSGKTTTLYSCLREINSRERKIITIEDPVEYPLPGINQTQISHKAGLSFPVSLRAILRQDPDVIMVGEIRDRETLEAAMHAALTGHLVFSTIHTNSTAKTITRLREMGAPPYMISSTVIGVVAQRLIRKICESCKTSYPATPEECKILGFNSEESNIDLYKGQGCEQCSGSGYRGRVGLYEIMNVTHEIQQLIDEGASARSIQDAAIQNGMITLGMDGERKVAAGMTTVAEVSRVLGIDW